MMPQASIFLVCAFLLPFAPSSSTSSSEDLPPELQETCSSSDDASSCSRGPHAHMAAADDGKISDRALGCLLGALVGDASGAVLEFQKTKVTAKEVAKALTMPGGGVWKVGPGQITDDGELTLCLARGLVAGEGKFDLDKVTKEYSAWFDSPPFDIGTTTTKALEVAFSGLAKVVRKAARDHNQQSQSNGCLMRSTPMALWGHKLSDAQLMDIVAQEVSLTHPNKDIQNAVGTYVVAAAYLINNGGGTKEARKAAFDKAKTVAGPLAREWLELAASNEHFSVDGKGMGWIKWGFTLAFRHLLYAESYEAALRDTLVLDGDTDTNACIVGGLYGAAVGASAIPTHLKEPVLSYSFEDKGGQRRPPFLYSRQAPGLAAELMRLAPSAGPQDAANDQTCGGGGGGGQCDAKAFAD
ncbi:unnamed protein product [Vitrella brassicaformis CCMP3155]|uniref:Uncharacterized protein n=1 Tax=Vitrella brassicaformis (strain CCMP3155) TaxID=1169540 RepID=A0A0G4EI42_VITBC|nr:unnamed protein product [Vitrella brassicaformis CCMP3155]|mmetsp:Transcript_30626/g.76031  ORF Transcript_30626/g.76031 Transcript_30626/m.76031 type:complete len:412 (-) Transcript_30626:105-1340(-)|eukprot:CEL95912.1 unnamed protein product [Vitrella brassicaformis CCMP3155]